MDGYLEIHAQYESSMLCALGLDCYLALLASLFLSEMEAGDLVSPPLEDLLCSPFTLMSVEGMFSSVELLPAACFRGQGSFRGDISLARNLEGFRKPGLSYFLSEVC